LEESSTGERGMEKKEEEEDKEEGMLGKMHDGYWQAIFSNNEYHL
jgi:hypothetical protein